MAVAAFTIVPDCSGGVSPKEKSIRPPSCSQMIGQAYELCTSTFVQWPVAVAE